MGLIDSVLGKNPRKSEPAQETDLLVSETCRVAERDGILSVRFAGGVCQYTIADHPLEGMEWMARRVKVRSVRLDGTLFSGEDMWKSRWRYAGAEYLMNAYYDRDPEVDWLAAHGMSAEVLTIWAQHRPLEWKGYSLHLPFELYGVEANPFPGEFILMYLDCRYQFGVRCRSTLRERRCDVCREQVLACSFGVVDHLDPEDFARATFCLGGAVSVSPAARFGGF